MPVRADNAGALGLYTRDRRQDLRGVVPKSLISDPHRVRLAELVLRSNHHALVYFVVPAVVYVLSLRAYNVVNKHSVVKAQVPKGPTSSNRMTIMITTTLTVLQYDMALRLHT